MPSEWDNTEACTYSVTNPEDGTELASGDCDVLAADVVEVAAPAGTYYLTLTAGGSIESGQVFNVGSKEQGFQLVEVDDYSSVPKMVTLEEGLLEDVNAGADMYARDVYATFNPSLWPSGITSVAITWDNGKNVPLKELYIIRKGASIISGLDMEFKTAFPDLYDNVNDGELPFFRDRARQVLKLYFQNKGRNFDLVVDNELLKESMLLEMALLIGESVNMNPEQYDRLTAALENQLDLIDGLPIWVDINENDVKDDGEETIVDNFYSFNRSLF